MSTEPAPIVLPHPPPRYGSQAVRTTSSVEQWIAAIPRRKAPAVDYGTQWRNPGPEDDHWRVLWNTATREVFAIRTSLLRPGTNGEVWLMGICPSRTRADAVVAALPALHALVPYIQSAGQAHGVSARPEPHPPGPEGVGFVISRPTVGPWRGQIAYHYHATRPHHVEAALRAFRVTMAPERVELDPDSGYQQAANDDRDAALDALRHEQELERGLFDNYETTAISRPRNDTTPAEGAPRQSAAAPTPPGAEHPTSGDGSGSAARRVLAHRTRPTPPASPGREL